MSKPVLSIIAAISSKNRALGFKNGLLWKLPGDLPRFKQLTSGHPVIIGLNTFKSIGRPLPNRTNILVSQTPVSFPEFPELLVTNNIDEAIGLGKEHDKKEVFIIGGGQIYKSTIDKADRLYLTLVNNEPEADTFFPEYEHLFKNKTLEEPHLDSIPPYTFVTLEK